MRVLQYGDTSAFNMIEPYISTSIARVIIQWYEGEREREGIYRGRGKRERGSGRRRSKKENESEGRIQRER